ncbi:hypothetical protein [Bradyrhizobium sp. 33ap4]|uniref:hypothetical protein n=1 Tax=Bradyrhizobium sp. 33ap4 TaxID=3061630 RepID=UPI00292E2CB3|nr:hypothetical protein [Bradyrhizobium sp. 33ap4]
MGPELKKLWTKLTKVPDLIDAYLDKLGEQLDAQMAAEDLSVSELETAKQMPCGLAARFARNDFAQRCTRSLRAAATRVLASALRGLTWPAADAESTDSVRLARPEWACHRKPLFGTLESRDRHAGAVSWLQQTAALTTPSRRTFHLGELYAGDLV